MPEAVMKKPPVDNELRVEKHRSMEERKAQTEQLGELCKAGAAKAIRGFGRVLEHFGTLTVRLMHWMPWLCYFVVVLLVIVLAAYFFQADGLRNLIPQTGTKLSKLPIPGIEVLARYRGWNKMDMACVLATLFAVFTFLSWDSIIKFYFQNRVEMDSRWQVERIQSLTLLLGGVILLWDAYLFYQGIVLMGWGGSFSLTPFLATCGWVALMIAASVKSIELQPSRPKKEGEES